MSDKDTQAFPMNYGAEGLHVGMTLRDYFAAKAMQTMLSYPAWLEQDVAHLTLYAYEVADSMMESRKV